MASRSRAALIALKGIAAGKSLLRGVVYVGTVLLILNGSPAADFLHLRIQPHGQVVSPFTEDSVWGTSAYFAGWVLLAVLVLWTWRRFAHQGTGWSLVAAVCALAVMYLSDSLLSTANIMQYHERAWVYFVLAVFFAVIHLFENEQQRLHLLDFVLLCVGVQSGYAIAYYLLDINQFVTPGFGNRTSGTFFNPNVLYPITLMGVVLAFYRALHEPNRVLRWLLWGIGWLSVIATTLTFTRIAWVALAVVLALFAVANRERLRGVVKVLLLTCAVLFIVGMPFVPEDRSFWGRWHIWNVSLQMVLDRPFLGHGFQTYLEKRNPFMTSALNAFGPLNTEAKNLLLNIAVEFGIVGVTVFVWVIITFIRLTQAMLRRCPQGTYSSLWSAGRDVLITLLVCGTVDTPVLERYRIPSSWVLMLLLGLIANAALSLSTPSETAKRLSSASRHPFTLGRLMLWGMLTALFVLGTAPFVSGYLQFRHYQRAIPALRTQNPARPRLTPLAQTAPAMRAALIASEDGYFLQHHGVDWQALHRALRVNIRNLRFKQGGSTITMQTARYILLGREKTLPRKVAEILLALEMERQLSKERILELYLNSVRFGLGAEDIGTACAVYFGKKPSQLSLAEAGFLAGVLPEPPRTREELTLEKVERCKRRALGRLVYLFPEKYSRQQIEQALQERITFVWQKGGS